MSSFRWFARGAGVALIVLCGAIARIDDLTRHIPLFLLLFGAAFAVYAGALFALRRRGVPGPDAGGREVSARGELTELLLVAAVCRIVLIPATPTLSTDIYRYMWEGKVVSHGYNPFAHAPEAESLAHLRDHHHERINHKELETIYPPVAQAIFAVGAWVTPDPWGQKALFVLFDLATVLALIALLRARGGDPAMSVVYAWNPLVIVETAHSGHLDPVGVFLLVAALLWLEKGRRVAGSVALGLSALAKYTAILLVPFLLRRRGTALWVGIAALVVVIGYLPFAGAGTKLFTSLGIYGRDWSFNGSVYSVVVALARDPDVARLLLAGLMASVVIVAVARERDITRYAFVTIGAALLLVPTLYPWYLCWIVPLLCVHFNRAWVLLTGLIFASYWVWVDFAREGDWLVRPAVMVLEYVPFYALLVTDALRRRGAARRRDALGAGTAG